jgi:hypothetical protein
MKERFRANAARQMGKTAMREHVRQQGSVDAWYSRILLTLGAQRSR